MVYGCVGHFGPGVEEVHPLDEVAHPEAQGLAGLVGVLLQIGKERRGEEGEVQGDKGERESGGEGRGRENWEVTKDLLAM